MKFPAGTRLVVASHNPGKIAEIYELLAPLHFDVTDAAALRLAEPDETGASFAENAALKARAAANATGLTALADDSGLAVLALDGAPGIFSARWAGEERNFAQAMMRVERALNDKGASDLSAKFVCALALAEPGGPTQVYEGEVHGRLKFPPQGWCGFGYDPIFVADGMSETFGELDPARKHAISHRARAFAKLTAFLTSPACGRGAPEGSGARK